MGGRAGVRGAGVAVVAVVVLCLLLLPGSVPIVPGRPPSTPDPAPGSAPVGGRPGGPTVDIHSLIVRYPVAYSAGGDPTSSVGLEGSSSVGGLTAVDPPVTSVDIDDLDASMDADRDGDRSTTALDTAFVSLFLVLILLTAAGDRDRQGRRPAARPAPESASAGSLDARSA